MFDKKKIDISEIVKESVREAMKTHGLVREQEEKKQWSVEPFDIEKHMPTPQIRPQEWGAKETPEAAQIDAVLKNVIREGSNSLETVRNTLANINDALGISVHKEGTPVYSDNVDPSSISSIVSALKIKHVFNSIIYGQSAQVAGKMLEGLFSRIVSGKASSDLLNPIEDFYDKQGNYISLKVLQDKSDFKGSKLNLAKGIADKGEVIYLVLLKSSTIDPFSLKTYSFKVNKYNYFPIISNRKTSEIDVQSAYKLSSEIIGKNSVFEFNNRLKNLFKLDDKRFEQEYGSSALSKTSRKTSQPDLSLGDFSKEQMNAAVVKYAASLGLDVQSAGSIKDHVRSLFDQILANINKVDPDLDETSEDHRAILYAIDNNFKKISQSNQDNFLKAIVASGDNFFKASPLGEFNAELDSINKKDDFAKAKIFEPDETLRKAIDRYSEYQNIKQKKKDSDEGVNISDSDVAMFQNIEQRMPIYKKRYRIFTSKIMPLTTAMLRIKDYAEKSMGVEKQPVEQFLSLSDSDKLNGIINVFFEMIKDSTITKEPVSSQFEYDISSALTIAKLSESDYSEDYPIFVIEKKWLNVSTQKNVKAIKEVLEPFYRAFHEIDSGLEGYMVHRVFQALAVIERGSENMKNAVENHITKYGEKTPDQITSGTETNTQLQENNKKPLTKHWTEIMLEELTK